MQISLDRTRLVMVNVQKADETIYTCVARNPAGEATREFQLIVLGMFSSFFLGILTIRPIITLCSSSEDSG
jgi:hypothetical protein